MNRLARWMIRLYPAQWRARYGDEVDALLTDAGADARTVADLARGGVRMQFSTWSFLKLTMTLGLAGVVLGGVFSLFLPTEYTSKATMEIAHAQVDATITQSRAINNPLNEQVLLLETEVLSEAHLITIIRKLRLYPEASPDDLVERMRNGIHITFVTSPSSIIKGASAFDITFTYPDRFKARQALEALMSAFNDINQASAIPAANAADRPAGTILVLDDANLPQVPFNRSSIVGHLTSFLGNLFPAQYRSAATLRLKHGTSQQVLEISDRVLSRSTLVSIINDPRLMLYREELRTTPSEDVIDLMRRHVQISLVRGDPKDALFTVTFDYPDRYKARETVQAITNQFRQVSVEIFPGRVAPAGVILDVLDTASLPSTPSKPHRPLIALAGGILGVILGVLISIIRRLWMRPTIAPVGE